MFTRFTSRVIRVSESAGFWGTATVGPGCCATALRYGDKHHGADGSTGDEQLDHETRVLSFYFSEVRLDLDRPRSGRLYDIKVTPVAAARKAGKCDRTCYFRRFCGTRDMLAAHLNTLAKASSGHGCTLIHTDNSSALKIRVHPWLILICRNLG
jgi:hypothetical protein